MNGLWIRSTGFELLPTFAGFAAISTPDYPFDRLGQRRIALSVDKMAIEGNGLTAPKTSLSLAEKWIYRARARWKRE